MRTSHTSSPWSHTPNNEVGFVRQNDLVEAVNRARDQISNQFKQQLELSHSSLTNELQQVKNHGASLTAAVAAVPQQIEKQLAQHSQQTNAVIADTVAQAVLAALQAQANNTQNPHTNG